MKHLVTALALAALMASPAIARDRYKVSARAAAAQAYAPSESAGQSSAMNNPYVVVVNGQLVGADPDPSVRLSLRKDAGLQASN